MAQDGYNHSLRSTLRLLAKSARHTVFATSFNSFYKCIKNMNDRKDLHIYIFHTAFRGLHFCSSIIDSKRQTAS